MKHLSLALALLPLCCYATGPKKVVIVEKASELKRARSMIANSTNNVPDWEMDYLIPQKDAARLKGLKLRVTILDKAGHRAKNYTTFIGKESGSLRVSINPKQANRVWRSHELSDVGEIIIVGEPTIPRS